MKDQPSIIYVTPDNERLSTKYSTPELAAAYIKELREASIWGNGDDDMSARALRGIIEEHIKIVLTTTSIDLKNHNYGRYSRDICEFLNATEQHKRDDLLQAAAWQVGYDLNYKANIQDITDIIMGTKVLRSRMSCLTECSKCGERIALELCGDTLRLSGAECVPVGYYQTEVEFPTGKVITGDSIGEIHEYIRDNYAKPTDNLGMESDASHRDISAMFARAGMYHVFVGNSCPGLHLDRASGTITIGNSGYDQDDDEITYDLPGEKLDSICTDLWWASIIDIKTFKKLLKKCYGGRLGARLYKEALFTGRYTYDVIEIPPGKYIGTSYHHIDGYPDKCSTPHKAATLELVK